jgi:hypothetical protein
MTTRSDLVAGIQPGSLPHGNRAKLEEGLKSVVPAPSPTDPGGIGGAAPPPDAAGDPLAALLSGEINPGQGSAPLTDGLSVGPGVGPNGPTPSVSPEMARLQQIAMQAKSPLLRQMARNELRRIVREPV